MRRRLKSPASKTGRCSSTCLAGSMPISWLSTAAKVDLWETWIDVEFRGKRPSLPANFSKISFKSFVGNSSKFRLAVRTLFIRLRAQVEVHFNNVSNNQTSQKIKQRSAKSRRYRSAPEWYCTDRMPRSGQLAVSSTFPFILTGRWFLMKSKSTFKAPAPAQVITCFCFPSGGVSRRIDPR